MLKRVDKHVGNHVNKRVWKIQTHVGKYKCTTSGYRTNMSPYILNHNYKARLTLHSKLHQMLQEHLQGDIIREDRSATLIVGALRD